MASKSENAEIAVLQDQMDTLKADVKEIGHDTKIIMRQLDQLPQNFVTTATFENYRIANEKELNKIRKRRWVENTLSAAAGVALTALIIYFVLHQVSL